jgi:hypothetical protein
LTRRGPAVAVVVAAFVLTTACGLGGGSGTGSARSVRVDQAVSFQAAGTTVYGTYRHPAGFARR